MRKHTPNGRCSPLPHSFLTLQPWPPSPRRMLSSRKAAGPWSSARTRPSWPAWPWGGRRRWWVREGSWFCAPKGQRGGRGGADCPPRTAGRGAMPLHPHWTWSMCWATRCWSQVEGTASAPHARGRPKRGKRPPPSLPPPGASAGLSLDAHHPSPLSLVRTSTSPSSRPPPPPSTSSPRRSTSRVSRRMCDVMTERERARAGAAACSLSVHPLLTRTTPTTFFPCISSQGRRLRPLPARHGRLRQWRPLGPPGGRGGLGDGAQDADGLPPPDAGE